MKNVLLVVLAMLGALGILVVSIYLLRKARIMKNEGAKSFRYIRLSQNSERVTESQCLVDVSTEEEDDDEDDDGSPATIDVESRTAGMIKMNGQANYRRASAVTENETDEELLQ